MTTQHHTRASRSTKPFSQQRQLKVREAYHTYQLQQNRNDRTSVGEIHLKGHWLIQAGFDINTPVTIRVMDGCLVLTTEPEV